jgi:hypothetical protein
MRTPRARIALAAVALLAAPAAAQDARFEAPEALYGLTELGDTGLPLWRQLFSRGWPTDATYRQATLDTSEVTFERGVSAYLASGAGVPLSATAYEALRFKGHQEAGGTCTTSDRLLRQELTLYKTLSGAAQLTVPQSFDPVAIPFQRGRAELVRPWVATDLGTWEWKNAQQPRHTLDALGFAMLAEVRFARLHLSFRRTEAVAGTPTPFYGRTANEGFMALIALHSAIAKLYELRELIIDQSLQSMGPHATLTGLNEMNFTFASAWASTVPPQGSGRATYALDSGPNKLRSELDGLSALLLATSELAALCDPDSGSKELKDLFAVTMPIAGVTRTLFEKDTFDKAVETAIFAFKSLRTVHVDVMHGNACSTGDPTNPGMSITPADMGLFLIAMQTFKDQVRLNTAPRGAQPNPRAADLAEELKKADILMRTLSQVIVTWEQGAGVAGIADVYNKAQNTRQVQTQSLASQAFAIRGLLVGHRLTSSGGESTPCLVSAQRIARVLDRELWDPAAGAYVDKAQGGNKASCLGAIAVVGALRELSLATGDGRYLARVVQHLGTLTRCGLIRADGGALAPGLSAEVPIRG